jgi:hypothetical protein
MTALPHAQAERNLATIRRAYAAFVAGDVPLLLYGFAPEAVFTCHGAPALPYGGLWQGHAGLVAFLEALGSTAEVLEFLPESVLALPDGRVMAEGRERLRFRATGVAAVTRWLHLFRLAEGRIIEGVEWNEGAILAAACRSP